VKLAASNIAWPAGADVQAASVLSAGGATGVELAPKKVWPKPLEATESDAAAVRGWWERRGLRVCAMQALLFGRADLTLFDDAATRGRTVEYLAGVIRLAGWLGAGAMVFGSPKNRLTAGRPAAEVRAAALDAFRHLGDIAVQAGTCFCIEANPPEYGCDWVTTAAEAAALVTGVGHPGFGLHLDAGGMALTGELGPLPAGAEPRHFHVSEPHLRPVGGPHHAALAAALQAAGYAGWHSIEMRQPEGDWAAALAAALGAAARSYAGRAAA
jgi:D-psicose/D-tagatose/L-ribulose 3-epimerase